MESMTINLTPYEHASLCYGNTWVVADEHVLAQQIARVALGQSRHVRQILAGASLGVPASTKNAQRERSNCSPLPRVRILGIGTAGCFKGIVRLLSRSRKMMR